MAFKEEYAMTSSLDMEGDSGVYHKGGGCWVSRFHWLLLLLAALLLATTVGLLVYYYAPRPGQGTDGSIESSLGGGDGGGGSGGGEQSATTPSTQTEQPSYRLPTNLAPILYEIQIRPDIYSGDPSTFNFTASCQVTFKCETPTDRIVLHTNKITVNSSSVQLVKLHVNGSVSGEVGTGEMDWEELRQFLTLPVDEVLEQGQQYRLTMDYTGPIPDDLDGLYYGSYQDGSQTKYFLTSQLQPTSAREVFPCWDEPLYKAQYDIVVDRKPPFKSMSNGEIVQTTQLSDGWERDFYSRSPYMSSYLVALMVTEFVCVLSPTSSGTEVQVCSRPSVSAQTNLALQASVSIQEYYEELFNLSYPLPNMAHVGVPDFSAGAMENWGLVIYRESLLLYQSGTTSTAAQIRVVDVMAHEISHQWFGNLVTMAWWDDIWLNEGFATYMQGIGTEAAFPDWDMEADLLVSAIQYVMSSDSLASSRPVRKDVQTTPEIYSLFDVISYYKGSACVRMMRYFLGEETFRWGISKYLHDRAYGIGSSESLMEFLTQEARKNAIDVDVQAVMATWLEQLGYPVVTYDLDLQTRKIRVSQQHFLLDQDSSNMLPESEFGYVWQVPISYIIDTDTDIDNWQHYKYWLTETTAELEVEVPQGTSWIIGNVKERFYYRVNYNEDNWAALVDTLIADHTRIDVTNRAQLLDDSFNLGRAGVLNQTRFLDLTLYLSRETSYFPWRVALSSFGYFNDIFASTSQYGLFRSYMRHILEEPYTRLGWTESSSSNLRERQLRGTIIGNACFYGLRDCLERVEPLFEQWLRSQANNNPIAPDLRLGVYCAGVAAGDESVWEATFARLQTEQSATEANHILRALGCARQPWLLQRYLEKALSGDGIRLQDMYYAIVSVAYNNIGGAVAWQFLIDNYDALIQRDAFSIERYITAPVSGFSADYQYDQIESFIGSRDDLGAALPAFRRALETVGANIEWRAANEETITRWMTQALQQTA